VARDRFKKLNDLFIKGRHVDLPDGSHLWVQVLNTYERDDCISAAQVARSRLILALKNKGEESTKVMAHIAEVGYEEIARDLAEVKTEDSYFKSANQIRDDPDWKERMEILDKTEVEDIDKLVDEEKELLSTIQQEFMAELDKRRDEERELARHEFQMMTDEELEEAFLDAWLDKKGSLAGQLEYQRHEVAFAARYCDEEGEVEPDVCKARGERVFDEVEQVRHAPQDLIDSIRTIVQELSMGERDPKDLASTLDSSASLPMPNEPAESTASTSSETPPSPPGTSSQPSLTH
jgi:hypothetical protein